MADDSQFSEIKINDKPALTGDFSWLNKKDQGPDVKITLCEELFAHKRSAYSLEIETAGTLTKVELSTNDMIKVANFLIDQAERINSVSK